MNRKLRILVDPLPRSITEIFPDQDWALLSDTAEYSINCLSKEDGNAKVRFPVKEKIFDILTQGCGGKEKGRESSRGETCAERRWWT